MDMFRKTCPKTTQNEVNIFIDKLINLEKEICPNKFSILLFKISSFNLADENIIKLKGKIS